MIRFLIGCFFFAAVFPTKLQAQPSLAGKLQIIQDSRVPTLVEKHMYICQSGNIEGYRVQIYFDSGNNSKNRAVAKKGQFISLYAKVGAYLIFQSPNYKVRVGDFRTRMDAEGFKAEILGLFTDAFVVKDEINYPELEPVY